MPAHRLNPSTFFTVALLFILSCNENSESSTDQSDSMFQKVQHEDLHTPFHDTAVSSHTTAVTGEVLADMNSHLKKVHKTGNVDKDFLEMLKIFIEAESELAYLELAKGTNNNLKDLADSIKATSTQSFQLIERQISKTKNRLSYSSGFYIAMARYLNAINNDEGLVGLKTMDMQFVNMLLKHHEKANAVMEIYLKYGKNEELKKLVESFIQTYQSQTEHLARLQ